MISLYGKCHQSCGRVQAVDFWRNIQKQTVLRKTIVQLLDEKNILPFERLQAIADRIVELAKALHQRLTT